MTTLWIKCYIPTFKMTYKESYSKVFRAPLWWHLLSSLCQYCTLVNCTIPVFPLYVTYSVLLRLPLTRYVIVGCYTDICTIHFIICTYFEEKMHSECEFKRIACKVLVFAHSMFCWIIYFSFLAIDMIGNAPSLSFVISIRSTRCNSYMYLHHRKCWVQHVVPVWCMIIQIISTLYTQCNFQIRFSILIYIKNTKLDI